MNKKRVQTAFGASLIALTMAGSVFLATHKSPKGAAKERAIAHKERRKEFPLDCMIPDCKDAKGPVDCQRLVQPPMTPKGTEKKPMWLGCNVIPKDEAVGKECLPVACVTYAGEK